MLVCGEEVLFEIEPLNQREQIARSIRGREVHKDDLMEIVVEPGLYAQGQGVGIGVSCDHDIARVVSAFANGRALVCTLRKPLQCEVNLLGVFAFEELGKDLFGNTRHRKGVLFRFTFGPCLQAVLIIVVRAIVGIFLGDRVRIHRAGRVKNDEDPLTHGLALSVDAFMAGKTSLYDGIAVGGALEDFMM